MVAFVRKCAFDDNKNSLEFILLLKEELFSFREVFHKAEVTNSAYSSRKEG